MSTESELMAIERQFWTGGAEFYRGNVDAECLVAFPEMSRVMTREQVADSVQSDQPRWSDLRIELRGCLEPADGVAMLTYEARARRASGEPYRALASSAYVRRGGGWKLAFHQQTPLPAGPPADSSGHGEHGVK